LVLEDEAGFSLVSPLKRTWAPRGHTPVLRTSISHHSRINVLGAVLISPHGRRIRLCSRLHHGTVTGREVVAFLRQLVRRVRGPIVLVWDNHPIHQRKLVQQFIARHPRLHVFQFPAYAPELNPAEGIWTQAAEALAGTAPHNVSELQVNLATALRRVRRSARRLWACIFMSDLPWKR
jgi:putative transposase